MRLGLVEFYFRRHEMLLDVADAKISRAATRFLAFNAEYSHGPCLFFLSPSLSLSHVCSIPLFTPSLYHEQCHPVDTPDSLHHGHRASGYASPSYASHLYGGHMPMSDLEARTARCDSFRAWRENLTQVGEPACSPTVKPRTKDVARLQVCLGGRSARFYLTYGPTASLPWADSKYLRHILWLHGCQCVQLRERYEDCFSWRRWTFGRLAASGATEDRLPRRNLVHGSYTGIPACPGGTRRNPCISVRVSPVCVPPEEGPISSLECCGRLWEPRVGRRFLHRLRCRSPLQLPWKQLRNLWLNFCPAALTPWLPGPLGGSNKQIRLRVPKNDPIVA